MAPDLVRLIAKRIGVPFVKAEVRDEGAVFVADHPPVGVGVAEVTLLAEHVVLRFREAGGKQGSQLPVQRVVDRVIGHVHGRKRGGPLHVRKR